MEGVVVGSDQNQEWLLPWWWKHYSQWNQYPVAFIDFGLSDEMKAFCEERGTLIKAPESGIDYTGETPKDLIEKWHQRYGEEIWDIRPIWFKKPFAIAHAPFERCIWIDSDCLVKGSLAPLFHLFARNMDVALRAEADRVQKLHQELGFLREGEINYNSGVTLLRNGSSIHQQWMDILKTRAHEFAGDQQALSRAIFENNPPFLALPDHYNWSVAEGLNEEALIWHFHGGVLKNHLRLSILLEGL